MTDGEDEPKKGIEEENGNRLRDDPQNPDKDKYGADENEKSSDPKTNEAGEVSLEGTAETGNQTLSENEKSKSAKEKDPFEVGKEIIRNSSYEKPKKIPLRNSFGESLRASELWEFTVEFIQRQRGDGLLSLQASRDTIVSLIPELGFACASLHNCGDLLVKGNEKNTNFRGDGLGTGTIAPSISHQEDRTGLAFWCKSTTGLKKLEALGVHSRNLAIVPIAPHDHAPLEDLTRLTRPFIEAVLDKFYGEKLSASDKKFVRNTLLKDSKKAVAFWRLIARGVPNPIAGFREAEEIDSKFEKYVLAKEEDFPRESACLFIAAVFPNCGPDIFRELSAKLASLTPSRFVPEGQSKPPAEITDLVLKNCGIQFKTQEDETGARNPGPFLRSEGKDQRDVHQLAENFVGEAPLLTGRYVEILVSLGMLGHWNDDVARKFAQFAAEFQRRLSPAEGDVAFAKGFAEQTLMPMILGPMLAGETEAQQEVHQVDRQALLNRTVDPERLDDLLGALVEKGLEIRPMVRRASVLAPGLIEEKLRNNSRFSDELIGRLFWSLFLSYEEVRVVDFLPFVREESRKHNTTLNDREEAARRNAAAWPYEGRYIGLEEAARDGRLQNLIIVLGQDWEDLRDDHGLRSLLLFQLLYILLVEKLGDDDFDWLAFAAGSNEDDEDDNGGLVAVTKALYGPESEWLIYPQKLMTPPEIDRDGQRIMDCLRINHSIGLNVLVGSEEVLKRNGVWEKWFAHSPEPGRTTRLFSLMAITASMNDDGKLWFHIPKAMRKWLAAKDQSASNETVPNGTMILDDLKYVQRELETLPKLLSEMNKSKNFNRELTDQIKSRNRSMKEALRTFNEAIRGRKPKKAESEEIERELEE